ncbi:MAG TPA: hypothetical protein VK838_05935, partial [Candidatus Limnocylindrales bacterium]|nr:hypothetical protein [Candidatus Limnocylindrales bacterium]
ARRVRLRRWRPRGLSWSVLLLAALVAGVALDGFTSDQLLLANPDRSRVSEVRAVLSRLPARPLVLVGMDADLGTYPEIRPALRALLTDLLAGDARIAFVSFSPDGRAIAAAEVERLLGEGTSGDRLLDLGFVAGAEAGMVLAVTDLAPEARNTMVERAVAAAGGGIAAFDLAVVVGGIDFGPRSWVEQVATRLPALPLIAIAPSFAHPELAPYLRSGQIRALLATVRDGAAYARDVAERLDATPTGSAGLGQSPAAMLIGMLVALALLGRAVFVGSRAEAEPGTDVEDDS